MENQRGIKKMLLLGDCNHWLKEVKDESIDLIVSDPPYGIEFMGKDWDKALVHTETWKECYRVLKQGKLAFIMCSPRQDVLSRMIVNLQDAGFRTNYTSIYWTFASGFPKAANISKLIDKKAGAEREIIGESLRHGGGSSLIFPEHGSAPITKPATSEAKKMEGAYVGFQPKPAVEVILVVSKGKTLTWLDDCRIPYQSEDDFKTAEFGDKNGLLSYRKICESNGYDHLKKIPQSCDPRNEKGRFPANLLVSDDVLNDGSNHKSGLKTPLNNNKYESIADHKFGFSSNPKGHHPTGITGGDEGSYSRYFSLDSWAKTFPFLIVPKASRSERGEFNTHATVKPLKLMSYLITMGSREGDLILDPFCGSGTVCIAAHQLHRRWIGIEMNPEYAEIIKKRLADPLAQLKLTSYLENEVPPNDADY